MVEVWQYGAADQQIHKNIINDETLHIEQGDDLLFDAKLSQLEHLVKNGMDLTLTFKDKLNLQLENFFYADRPNRESILTFKDGLYTATEIEMCFSNESNSTITTEQLQQNNKHGEEHVLSPSGKVQGGSQLTALESSPFVYQFRLHDKFPEEAKVTVLVNGDPMPAWLSLKRLANRSYILSGIPLRADAGEVNLQIMIEVADG